VSRQRSRGRNVRGILLLDKPGGCTSNRALQVVKRLYGAAKAGHTGSLDPLATGMLPICFGSATRLGAYLLDASKRYRVVAKLGVATDTGDADGTTLETKPVPAVDEARIREVLEQFVGEIDQIPPMYSALKHDGVRLYELARRGETVEREARRVTIYSLALERWEPPHLSLEVHCSKGTYVRTLVIDVAAALGTVGHVVELRRLAVGPYREAQMCELERLEALAAEGGQAALDAQLLPLDSAVSHLPEVVLGVAAGPRFLHGQPVPANPRGPIGPVRVYVGSGDLVAIGVVGEDHWLRPRTVFS
jgi:tRNA pseudouridine55 synthase